MIVDISSITIKLSAFELEFLLIHAHKSISECTFDHNHQNFKNYNELCEVCNRKDLIIQ